MKEKIIVFGNFPPPYHGANIMAKIMSSVLEEEGYKTIVIKKSFSKSIETVGKISLIKIMRIPVITFEILVACLFKRPVVCIYFIAKGKTAFLVDAFFLFLLRLCHLPYILRFGDKGFKELAMQSYFWNFLVNVTLSKALGGLILGERLKSDVNTFIPNDCLSLVPNARKMVKVTSNKENKHIQILFLSNMIPKKGPMEVLKAAKIVVQKTKNVRFILAGGNPYPNFTQELKSYIRKNSLDEYVEIFGEVYGSKKNKLFASSDIFVFPTFSEAFGQVIIEAMRAGLPVISTAEGAIPEIVQDGITGYIINPIYPNEIADNILTLIENPEIRIRMGINGKKIFEAKYTLEVYAKNLNKSVRYFMEKINRKK